MVMSIEQVSTMIAVPRKMKLHDPLDGNRVEVLFGAEPMIEGVDENIVDVEENPAVGLLRNRAQKLPFAQSRIAERQVAGNVFQQYRAFQKILHLPDSLRHVANHL